MTSTASPPALSTDGTTFTKMLAGIVLIFEAPKAKGPEGPGLCGEMREGSR
jgi:hypothetical protein